MLLLLLLLKLLLLKLLLLKLLILLRELLLWLPLQQKSCPRVGLTEAACLQVGQENTTHVNVRHTSHPHFPPLHAAPGALSCIGSTPLTS